MDKDCSGSIERNELRHLLWISNGTNSLEPTPAALERAFKIIDLDDDGRLSRIEWLKYTGEYEPSTGTLKFSSTLKELWQKMDVDNSLSISRDEVEQLMLERALEIISTQTENCPSRLMKHFETLARN